MGRSSSPVDYMFLWMGCASRSAHATNSGLQNEDICLSGLWTYGATHSRCR